VLCFFEFSYQTRVGLVFLLNYQFWACFSNLLAGLFNITSITGQFAGFSVKCVNRVARKFENSVLNHASWISSTGIWDNELRIPSYIVHQNTKFLLVCITVCYLAFLLLVLDAQQHGWLNRILCSVLYLTLTLVWGCETDWIRFISPISKWVLFHFMIACEQHNDRMMCLLYNKIYCSYFPNL